MRMETVFLQQEVRVENSGAKEREREVVHERE
jgi:hypothetical protein